MNSTIQVSRETFTGALKDAFEAGMESERERIIKSLNSDAVIQTNMSAQWLTYVVEMIEGAK